jgi:hypothetical protein
VMLRHATLPLWSDAQSGSTRASAQADHQGRSTGTRRSAHTLALRAARCELHPV